ncbi:MAG: hypothetical protein E7091_09600 [Bacteroidales bacterium]|nr:hypothetical protein [Bacteroidales bacterium]
MSLLDDEEVLLNDKTVKIKAEMDKLLATSMFRRGSISVFVTELDSLVGRIEQFLEKPKEPKMKEHRSREIYSIDCRYLCKGDAYGWISKVSQASEDPILVIEHVTEVPDGDPAIYDDPVYVTNLLLRSWKNEQIYAGDLHIDRSKYTIILACSPKDAHLLERECGLCSYAWKGDFETFLEEWKNIATKHVTSP